MKHSDADDTAHKTQSILFRHKSCTKTLSPTSACSFGFYPSPFNSGSHLLQPLIGERRGCPPRTTNLVDIRERQHAPGLINSVALRRRRPTSFARLSCFVLTVITACSLNQHHSLDAEEELVNSS